MRIPGPSPISCMGCASRHVSSTYVSTNDWHMRLSVIPLISSRTISTRIDSDIQYRSGDESIISN
ncbi:hypothetical protein COCC4DRAFT_148894 [Bipolaris maydis ATCC 48331]|uniref:Uncharacterized protein n=2 Tax=Cochliobolus heterostrophus TaxID=5016 RepID=M2UGK9_COCH5|nr:uncharacterized protein COCC4DRAFT_148894 [Bipolaris maydis ATCC 48331]EMD96404.1 hypothetical protein COCHEDRAFT_1150121 [Bipolaris maydis C5]EMD97574.1 hypothetical protein COCHEDRAFT_1085916 [Bipolaris maydis C5]ENI01071.1 hypothetical protein COCC4DRAFT_148894 [Bipolaris maydis ATCC 48331]